MSDVPLHQHALLSDCGAAALVTAGGSVDWLCIPRFDSPAVFARLLDDGAGHFRIAPAAPESTSSWRYRPASLILDTTWACPHGDLLVTDAMALGSRERGHELGRGAPGVLLRRVRCIRGLVAVSVDFAPRPEFGLVHPRLTRTYGAVVADGGAGILVLSTEMELDVAEARVSGTVTLHAGQDLTFALEQCDAWGPTATRWKPRTVRRRLADAEAAWRSWSALHQRYEGPMRQLVHHSGVVLQGLTYARSGAVVAAPTTSLPEGVGSGRTWTIATPGCGTRA